MPRCVINDCKNWKQCWLDNRSARSANWLTALVGNWLTEPAVSMGYNPGTLRELISNN